MERCQNWQRYLDRRWNGASVYDTDRNIRRVFSKMGILERGYAGEYFREHPLYGAAIGLEATENTIAFFVPQFGICKIQPGGAWEKAATENA